MSWPARPRFTPETSCATASHLSEASLRSVRSLLRPFDTRWLLLGADTKPLDGSAPDLVPGTVSEGNRLFDRASARRRPRERFTGDHGQLLPDDHLLRPNVVAMPFPYRRSQARIDRQHVRSTSSSTRRSRQPLAESRTTRDAIGAPRMAEALWMHAACRLLHSPRYLQRTTRRRPPGLASHPSARPRATPFSPPPSLGRRVAALLDVESPVDAVTTGAIRYELRPIGAHRKADGSQIDPGAGDLAVTAGWGHAGQGGVTMPGRGRLVERAYTDEELAAFREGLADLGLTFEQLMACLGGTCCRCLPERASPTGAACPRGSGPTRSAATRS